MPYVCIAKASSRQFPLEIVHVGFALPVDSKTAFLCTTTPFMEKNGRLGEDLRSGTRARGEDRTTPRMSTRRQTRTRSHGARQAHEGARGGKGKRARRHQRLGAVFLAQKIHFKARIGECGSTSPAPSQGDLEATLTKLGEIFPTLENDLTVRRKIESLQSLSYSLDPVQLATFLLDFETLLGKLSENSMTDQDKFLHLINKLHPKTFQELRESPVWRPRTDTYPGIKQALTEKVKEYWVDIRLVVTQKNLLAQTEQMQVESAQTPQSTNYQHQPRSLGKRKGKGKGQRKRVPRKRTPSARTPSRSRSKSPNRFSATIICKWCGKSLHYGDRCFSKYPHLRPPRSSKPPPKFSRYRPENVQTNPQVTFEADQEFNSKKRKINLLSTLALSLGGTLKTLVGAWNFVEVAIGDTLRNIDHRSVVTFRTICK